MVVEIIHIGINEIDFLITYIYFEWFSLQLVGVNLKKKALFLTICSLL